MMEGKSILAKATISTCRIRAKHAKNSSYMLRDECRQNFPSEKYG